MIKTIATLIQNHRITLDNRFPGVALLTRLSDGTHFTLLRYIVPKEHPHRWYVEAHGEWIEMVDEDTAECLGFRPAILVKGDMTDYEFNRPPNPWRNVDPPDGPVELLNYLQALRRAIQSNVTVIESEGNRVTVGTRERRRTNGRRHSNTAAIPERNRP